MLSNWCFMHLIAMNFDVLSDCALSTSEKVPSPFRPSSLYLCILL
jgi:hypothetical protein